MSPPRAVYLFSTLATLALLYTPLYLGKVPLPFVPQELQRVTVLVLPMAFVALAGFMFVLDIVSTIAMDTTGEREKDQLLEEIQEAKSYLSKAGVL